MQFLLESPGWQCRRGKGALRIQHAVDHVGVSAKANERIKTVHVTKLSEYSEIISAQRSENSQDLILFRGHRLSNWLLLPKIGRMETRLKANTESAHRLVENQIFSLFRRLSVPFLGAKPVDDFELLAIAQHHGLPTRLLDWTSNALAALWFAVREASDLKTNAAIWILNPADTDFFDSRRVGSRIIAGPFDVDEVMVYRPRHMTTRIIAQSGYFTVHPLLPRNGIVKRFLPVEAEKRLARRLTKIEIPESSFCDLRDNLERHGVSDLTMFPDLEGVARFIEWNYTFMKDEDYPGEVLLNQT